MLRRATPTDAESIFQVHMASIRGLARGSYTFEQIEAWCAGKAAANYVHPLRTRVMFVATSGEKVVGFSQLSLDSSVVEAVYVHPAFARQGLGLELLRALEEVAHGAGVACVRLKASVNAVDFYLNAGYSPLGPEQHLLDGGISLPCVSMERHLE